MQEIVFKMGYFLFFLLNPISFNEQDHEKQKGPGTSDQSLIRLKKNSDKFDVMAITFSLANCELNCTSFGVFGEFAPM